MRVPFTCAVAARKPGTASTCAAACPGKPKVSVAPTAIAPAITERLVAAGVLGVE